MARMSDSAQSHAPSRKALHPLRYADFRRYIVARVGSVMGQYALIIVIGWQAYSTARLTMGPQASAAQLGLIGLCQFVPVFFLSPISGWIADHYDRRRVAMLSVSLQLLSAVILGWATWADRISLPLLFSVAALLGTSRCFSGPSFGSMVPRLVPRESMPRAVAFSSLMWQLSMIVGPALGGYIYSVLPWGPHLMAAILFVTTIVAVRLIAPIPPSGAVGAKPPLRQIIDGFVYVRGNRLVLGTITLDMMAVLLAGSTALLPIYARDIFQAGPQGLGQLAAAPGIGAALTALIFGMRPPEQNVGNKMLGSVVIFGMATVLFGVTALMPQGIAMPVALFALFVCGVSDMFSVFIRQTLIQVYTPDEMRGRVSSFSLVSISASNELGEAESGFLAALVGPVTAVVAGGVGAIATVFLWRRMFPEIGLARRFDAAEKGSGTNAQEKQA